ncbi:MAG: SGNH/GDSL hydrolase family protein [Lentisphaeria bacterium]|nr:SGNH/GDSL hydrolase family protein [Lentisphaeria bacterium]
MKKNLLIAGSLSALMLAVTGCGTMCPAKKCEGKKAETQAVLCQQKNIFIPKDIYAVEGEECNIYFKNIFLAVNHSNFIFDVNCKAGKQESKRWTFVPGKSDAGKSYKLTLKVYNCQEKLVAEDFTTVHVVAANAAEGKSVNILMVGDSLTNATYYPARLHELCGRSNAPKLHMIGSHSGSGRKVTANGVAHEGYGGWRWTTFLSKYNPKPDPKARYAYAASSKFLFPKADNSGVEFSLKKYLDKYSQGKTPDVITFQLGVNDVFNSNAENLEKNIAAILANADKLIAAFRKEAPNALIGVGFVTAGADQDAFGHNYKCNQTAWGYYRNSFRLNQAMAKHFANYPDKKVVMIPGNTNLDCENNFPAKVSAVNARNEKVTYLKQNNGVHPAPAGYRQMGDTYYAWLKNMLVR